MDAEICTRIFIGHIYQDIENPKKINVTSLPWVTKCQKYQKGSDV